MITSTSEQSGSTAILSTAWLLRLYYLITFWLLPDRSGGTVWLHCSTFWLLLAFLEYWLIAVGLHPSAQTVRRSALVVLCDCSRALVCTGCVLSDCFFERSVVLFDYCLIVLERSVVLYDYSCVYAWVRIENTQYHTTIVLKTANTHHNLMYETKETHKQTALRTKSETHPVDRPQCFWASIPFPTCKYNL